MRWLEPLAAKAGPAACALIVAACASPTASPTPAVPAPSSAPTLTIAPLPSASAPATTSPTAPATGTPFATATISPASAAPSPSEAQSPAAHTLAIDAADVGRHLDALQAIADQNDGIRAAGTSGYDASVDYVAGELGTLGFDVSQSPVDLVQFAEVEPTVLEIGQESWTSPEWLNAMLYSPSGDVTAVAETVGIVGGQPTLNGPCSASEWSDFDAGSVAVVMGGPCYRRDVALLAQQKGATALISLYPAWGANHVLQPTLIDPAGLTIPVVGAGQAPSAALLTAAANGETVHLKVTTELTPTTTHSVIAELPGSSDEIVMLGGHLDSVLAGPGINDNGSGVATLLALARSISERGTPQATIRLGFWAAEEYGDIGSAQYVGGLRNAGVLDRMSAYLNMDMVASPNAGRYVYADSGSLPGSTALTDDLLAALAAQGTPGTTTDTGGRSDHAAFALAGVPVGGVFSGLDPVDPADAQLFGATAGEPADACYHLSCDTRDNIDVASAVTLGSAVATVLERLAY